MKKTKIFLAINRCPVHRDFMSVSIDDENGGFRLTPSKCCGRWETLIRWKIDLNMVKDMREQLTRVARALRKGQKNDNN